MSSASENINEGVEDKSKASEVSWWLLAGMWIFVIGCWLLWEFWVQTRLGLAAAKGAGEYGDLFGGVNALFSGLAFATLIFTAALQKKELSLQRQELAETRAELQGQKIQLTLQASTLKQQADDTNFFRMLEMFRHMAQTIRHPGGCPNDDRRFVFRNVQTLLPLRQDELDLIHGVEYWRLIAKVCLEQMRVADGQRLEAEWSLIYRRWDTSLGPYFATLAELLELISGADQETSWRWARILRAQFGLQEMLPIFFYALSPVGRQRLKPHIERFGMFAHFSDDPAYHEVAIRNWYLAGAFLPQGTT